MALGEEIDITEMLAHQKSFKDYTLKMIGTKSPRPILFDGQAVIGAAGRMMRLPRYNDKNEIVARYLMEVQWVGDHRHLDGAGLARFSNSFKRYMEQPGEWLLTLK